MKNNNKVIEEFREKFVVPSDLGWRQWIITPDPKEIEDFLLKALNQTAQQAREEIKKKVVEFAVEGADSPDDIKGLELYSKIMNLLSQENK